MKQLFDFVRTHQCVLFPTSSILAGADTDPLIALLDGLPLSNHALLAGRLVVDDPDGWDAEYEAKDRVHGTSMASLVLYGELDGPPVPLGRKLYVRPIAQWKIFMNESTRRYGRFALGRLPTHQSFGNNFTRVAVRIRHPPDASGLVNHRSGEGHETYLFSVAQ